MKPGKKKIAAAVAKSKSVDQIQGKGLAQGVSQMERVQSRMETDKIKSKAPASNASSNHFNDPYYVNKFSSESEHVRHHLKDAVNDINTKKREQIQKQQQVNVNSKMIPMPSAGTKGTKSSMTGRTFGSFSKKR